jgi:hypothetical protein
MQTGTVNETWQDKSWYVIVVTIPERPAALSGIFGRRGSVDRAPCNGDPFERPLRLGAQDGVRAGADLFRLGIAEILAPPGDPRHLGREHLRPRAPALKKLQSSGDGRQSPRAEVAQGDVTRDPAPQGRDHRGTSARFSRSEIPRARLE